MRLHFTCNTSTHRKYNPHFLSKCKLFHYSKQLFGNKQNRKSLITKRKQFFFHLTYLGTLTMGEIRIYDRVKHL